MTRAVLILANDLVRARAVGWIGKAPVGTRLEFKAPRRSHDQNALLWARLTDVARQVEWYGQKLTPEDWKDVFSASLRRARVVPGLDAGTFVPLGLRTSDLSKAEFSDLLELIQAFAAERGVVWSCEASMDQGEAVRAEFVQAVTAAAHTTDSGRTVLHSFLGGIGADWDLHDVVAEIAAADEVRWINGFAGHDLVVQTGSRRVCFAAKREAA